MSIPRQRRERCAFHYKVDEMLTPGDREAYLRLVREAGTTIDKAHRWLAERGYGMSRSAVARHRRRLLGGDREREAQAALAVELARMAGSPGAPDFAAGAEYQWQHVVFQRLIAAGAFIDAAYDPSAEPAPLPKPAELILLGKLVQQSIEFTRRRMQDSVPDAAPGERGNPPARKAKGAK